MLLNVSSHLKTTVKCESEIPDLFLNIVNKILSNKTYETEAVVRVLVAFGTILLVSDDFIQKAKSLFGSNVLSTAVNRHGEKAAAISAEIQNILM